MDWTLYLTVFVYLAIVVYLGYLGFKHTKSAKDYMIAGGETHPYLMAMAYGSTFISTAAIVGFGGAAAVYGMSLIWLAGANIVVGIFLAFIIFGKKTRAMAKVMDVSTFPEFLGKRFRSKFIQRFSALLITVAMPLYAAAVMIGGGRFMEQAIGLDYSVAITIFAVLVAAYVFFGGLKGILYTDAFQGTIMFVGMVSLLVLTYIKLGGVTAAHTGLTELANLVPEGLRKQGHLGWTAMPQFGSEIWLFVVTTLVLGVGVGVLAQPQLAVRYMTVKTNRELNRAIIVGGVFILFMTGVAFTVGSLTNVYFMETNGTISLGAVVDPVTGKPNTDKIIPLYISSAMPQWFSYLFMLTMLSAAMSTLSGQFHLIGTSISQDLYQPSLLFKKQKKNLWLARAGIVIALIVTAAMAMKLPGSIIALATAIFFGLCAAVFLPAYIAALYMPWVTRAGVVSAMLVGFVVHVFILFFVHAKEAAVFGVSEFIFGKPSLFAFPWNVIDPIVIALPIGFVTMVVVSWLTAPLPERHLIRCSPEPRQNISLELR